MDVPGLSILTAVSEANCHSEDSSSVVSSHFVEEVETLTGGLTTELY